MGIVKSEQAKGLTLERKMIINKEPVLFMNNSTLN
jgi:hypothetical protein